MNLALGCVYIYEKVSICIWIHIYHIYIMQPYSENNYIGVHDTSPDPDFYKQ